jgi:DNA topoisomerase-1
MAARTHVIAGRCTTTYDDGTTSDAADRRGHEQHGDVVVVCKPDDTVLVHDAEGYQPVAWLTRADRVAIDDDGLRAWKDDSVLEVTVDERYGAGRYPTGPAGTPVGDCPDCEATLVSAAGRVTCPACESRYGLPGDATLLDEPCEDCGLPRIAVTRGDTFRVCLDPGCEPLEDAVADAFDREWACPDCGEDLRVLRRGTLLLGCDAYPDCDWNTAVPRGEVVDRCECGLPVVDDGDGPSCLDDGCERFARPEAS